MVTENPRRTSRLGAGPGGAGRRPKGDDTAEYIASARSVGLRTIGFSSPERLRRELAQEHGLIA
jgi:hypothetical protein